MTSMICSINWIKKTTPNRSTMMSYLLAAAGVWLVFMGWYALALRREKLFVLNRAFLLLTPALALLIPAWPVALAAPDSPAGQWIQAVYALPVFTVGEAADSGPLNHTDWLRPALLWGYAMGCTVFAARFMRQLLGIAALVRSGQRRRSQGVVFVESAAIQAPFSFLWFLFWPTRHSYTPRELSAVQAHERAHIRQWHSLDLLLLEVMGIFFWWCPLWYLHSRYLREVHEYLADAAALKHTPARDYGRLLIRQCLGQSMPELAHGLRNHSQLKNRIAMMTKANASRLAMAKYLLFLPLAAFSVLACSAQTEKTAPAAEANYTPRVLIDTIITFDPATYKETMEIVRSEVYVAAEQMPVFGACPGKTGDELATCSTTNLMTYLGANMRYPEAARKNSVEGMVVAAFRVTPDGRATSAYIKKPVSPECDAEVLRLISSMPAWQPGTVDGKPVTVELTLPVRFKLGS
jgi:TonB family protein